MFKIELILIYFLIAILKKIIKVNSEIFSDINVFANPTSMYDTYYSVKLIFRKYI